MLKKRWIKVLAVIGLGILLIIGLGIITIKVLGGKHKNTERSEGSKTAGENNDFLEDISKEETVMVINKDLKALFQNMELQESYRINGGQNPLITQSFGADPYAMVYKDRVYVYMTNDAYMYDSAGNITTNTYSEIRSLRCISSADMVNWTDHGLIYVGGIKGVTTWANNSWAPAAIHKKIDGTDKFFLYFGNSASSIGVLTADSPTGPFRDPLGKSMITRETPNCAEVAWLFDPAVFTDDDGESYLYFGGGVPEGKAESPGTARVIQLGEDMISTVGEAVTIDAPYLFEDSGINKIGDTYYYSYCSNWESRENAKGEHVPEIAEIIYMTSNSPLGPWEYRGSILENPGKFFGSYGNNHHCMVEFKNAWYMFYHTMLLQDSMGTTGGYRSIHANEVFMNEDGSIQPIKADKAGVGQLKPFNPYEIIPAATMSDQGGIHIEENITSIKNPKQITLSGFTDGSWIKISGVDFTENGAKSFILRVACEGEGGAVRVTADSLEGAEITYVEINSTSSLKDFEDITVPVKEITGIHDIYLTFAGSGYAIESFSFEKK